jgi:hypothetical protein
MARIIFYFTQEIFISAQITKSNKAFTYISEIKEHFAGGKIKFNLERNE